MAQANVIGPLYTSVLLKDIKQFGITNSDIRTGIQNMKEVYKPNPRSLASTSLNVADYNDAAHRCAYLHKYAPFHTSLVADMLAKAIEVEKVKKDFINLIVINGRLDICSLGGGPGSDVLGVISILAMQFGFFQISATIIDCMHGWKSTFGSLIKELRDGNYGYLSGIVQPQYFDWNYIGHNLLDKMSNDVNKTIQKANLVTMVKFVSAAACKDTKEMLKKIFRSLKPGALVLYIDNAAGGFHEIIQKCAYECKLFTLFGPLNHEHYSNQSYNIVRFGYTPCLKTTVSVHIWRKAFDNIVDKNAVTNFNPHPVIPQIFNTNVSNTVVHYHLSDNRQSFHQYHLPYSNSSNMPQSLPQQQVLKTSSSHSIQSFHQHRLPNSNSFNRPQTVEPNQHHHLPNSNTADRPQNVLPKGQPALKTNSSHNRQSSQHHHLPNSNSANRPQNVLPIKQSVLKTNSSHNRQSSQQHHLPNSNGDNRLQRIPPPQQQGYQNQTNHQEVGDPYSDCCCCVIS